MQRYNYSQRNSFKPRSLRRFENRAKNKLLTTTVIGGILIILFLIWGLPTLVGGLTFLNKLKNTPKQDTAIADSAIAPPVLNIPYEATNSAAIKINGFATPNSKVEIYIDDELQTTTTTQSDGIFLTDNISLRLGTNNIYGKTLSPENKKSLDSKTIRLVYSNAKPKLNLSSPPDNQQIKGGDKKINVAGKTDPLNSIMVNGTTVIVSNDGNFNTTIGINEGDNFLTIIATDQFGNTNQIERKVTYSTS